MSFPFRDPGDPDVFDVLTAIAVDAPPGGQGWIPETAKRYRIIERLNPRAAAQTGITHTTMTGYVIRIPVPEWRESKRTHYFRVRASRSDRFGSNLMTQNIVRIEPAAKRDGTAPLFDQEWIPRTYRFYVEFTCRDRLTWEMTAHYTFPRQTMSEMEERQWLRNAYMTSFSKRLIEDNMFWGTTIAEPVITYLGNIPRPIREVDTESTQEKRSKALDESGKKTGVILPFSLRRKHRHGDPTEAEPPLDASPAKPMGS